MNSNHRCYLKVAVVVTFNFVLFKTGKLVKLTRLCIVNVEQGRFLEQKIGWHEFEGIIDELARLAHVGHVCVDIARV